MPGQEAGGKRPWRTLRKRASKSTGLVPPQCSGTEATCTGLPQVCSRGSPRAERRSKCSHAPNSDTEAIDIKLQLITTCKWQLSFSRVSLEKQTTHKGRLHAQQQMPTGNELSRISGGFLSYNVMSGLFSFYFSFFFYLCTMQVI